MGALETILAIYRDELSGLPSQISRDLAERRRIEDLVRGGMTRVADRFEQLVDDCRNGVDPTDRLDNPHGAQRTAA